VIRASGAATPFGHCHRLFPSLPSNPAEPQPNINPLFTRRQSDASEEIYHVISPGQRLRWFVASTAGPAHLTGVAFVAASGTAVNRPKEYAPHWRGFSDRFNVSMAGSAAGNALEAGVGFFLREDPRYFRLSQRPFKARVGNVVRLTFSARAGDGRVLPAYARFLGIVGGNFLSNTWRPHSEANARDALLRSSEGFAGRMSANAFAEFWLSVKGSMGRHIFRRSVQSPQTRPETAE
jgi:hypothetical protein